MSKIYRGAMAQFVSWMGDNRLDGGPRGVLGVLLGGPLLLAVALALAWQPFAALRAGVPWSGTYTITGSRGTTTWAIAPGLELAAAAAALGLACLALAALYFAGRLEPYRDPELDARPRLHR